MKQQAHISGATGSGRESSPTAQGLILAARLWLAAVLVPGLLPAVHAQALELDEFRYRRLIEHAEAAGYELNAERQIDNAGRYGLIQTVSDPSGANLYLDINDDQYLLESIDSM